MSLADLHHRILEQNILSGAILELTYRCNLDCFFCYNDTDKIGRPLDREQYFRFLSDMYDMNTLEVTLSGGEPLASPHFFHIGSRARELGFVVRIKSNGHALRGELARRVKEEIDPFKIEISLHGATAATHDRQTRVPGSFKRLVSNLRELKELGMRVKLNSALTKWNVNEVQAMYALADSLEIPLSFDSQITPRDNGDEEPVSISVSSDELEQFFRSEMVRRSKIMQKMAIIPVKNKTVGTCSKQCGSGSGGVTVDPYGNVYPCIQWRRTIGNLHEQSIGEIWNGSNELSEIRRINTEVKTHIEKQGECANEAGFCMGMAAMEADNPFHLYDGYKQRLAIRRKIASEKPD